MNEQTAVSFAPMQLGDIIDRVFKLIGKTVGRTIIVALIVMIPASVVFTFGLHSFFSSMVEMIRSGGMDQGGGLQVLLHTMGSWVLLLFGVLLVWLATLMGTLGTIIIGGGEMMHQQVSWQHALTQAVGVKFWKALGQTFLQGLAMFGLYIIPYLILVVGIGTHSTLVAILGGVLLFPAIGAVFYFLIKWLFAIPAIALEDAGVIQSFKRSSELVYDNWWRTCGIFILLSLIFQFALTLLLTPVYLITMWDFIVAYFSFISSVGRGTADPDQLLAVFGSFGMGLGIPICLSYIGSVVVTPLMYTVMYFDLRARHFEFPAVPLRPAPPQAL
jgi:membrane-anchored glycerophosphoryl diester phosphodiesterase (GDPDase)